MKTPSFSVDPACCVKCGACVADCAVHILEKKSDGFPVMIAARAGECMECRHCLAVCPTGAVSICGQTAADSRPLKGLDLPSAAQIDNLLRARRSVRHFKTADVAPAVIEEVLSTLANAPTGCNAHQLTFHVWKTREAMDRLRSAVITAIERHQDFDYQGRKLLPRWLALPAILYRRKGIDQFFRGAPHLLVVSADKRHSTTPEQDVTAAVAWFDLIAQTHGLGTCWCGFLDLIARQVPEVRGILGIGPDTPFYAMVFGLPAVQYHRTVHRDRDAAVVWH